ncbi:allantoinase (plasmid) [Halorientalis sp. IM1011]|uniref:dihydroorotase n=1 Tax=Halorientalis sp. IM1011 TaxID=1932360 RepID=UPI00097CD474|nr:amidohydrolase family protein [Halorientalis sp. IM1011]AQL44773.1 allantoinase [Halorientalis sp. IM1011]
MTVDLIISNGTVVTPNRCFEADVAVDDGTIVGIGDRANFVEAREVVDASGQLVMPGVVDPHVHIDGYLSIDPYEEGTSAAALGGVTSCVNFAWEAWLGDLSIWEEEGTLLEAVERQKRKGADSLIDYGLHGVITREDPAVFDELDAVIEEGVTSIKMFTAYEIGLSNGFMNRVFEEVADRDVVAVLHTEDASVCNALTERLKEEGATDPAEYPRARPDYTEAMAAEDAVRMAQEAGAKYYGIHTTCAKAADVLESFQTDGSEVRGETCTHYTALDESAYEEQGTLAIQAPPLRTPDDRDAMFEHLHNGALSVVSTDHVAFKRADKEVENWWDSSFGVNGLQTSLPVFHDEAVNKRGFSYPFLVRVMCTNPARTFGLPGKGTLEPGTDADIVIFDPDEEYTITADDNASVADYTIYEGRDVTGRVKKTFLRGELIADDGEIVAEPGYGEFIDRDIPDWAPDER